MLSKNKYQSTPAFKKAESITLFLEWSLLICSAALMLSWPLDHTIALRNISLAMGCFLGIAWLLFCRPTIQIKNMWAVLLLSCVPIWLLIHLFFLPVSFENQLRELKSLWLRVALSIPFAFSLGLILNKRPIYSKVLALVCATYPLIMFMMWAIFVISGDLSVPKASYIFKTKVAGTYFLMWSYLLGCALLHQLLLQALDKQLERGLGANPIIFFVGLLIAFSVFGMILLDSLNGVLVCVMLGLILVIICLKKISFGGGKSKYFQILVLVMVSMVLLGVVTLYAKYSPAYQAKLVPMMLDVKKSIDLKANKTWQRSPDIQGIPDPINDAGKPVHGSTYERVSWFIEGVNSLIDLPLGVGYVSQSFGHHMSTKYPGSSAQKTHSGWLDLAIGLGAPGILLLWMAMASVISRAFRNLKSQKSSINLAALWMLGGMFVLWWPAELGEREFVESLFFAIALFAGAAILWQPKLKSKG